MGLCIIGSEKSESNLKLLEESKKKFASVFFVPVEGIRIGLGKTFSITYRSSDLSKFDAIYPRIPSQLYSYAYQLISLLPSDTYTPIKPITFLIASDRFFLLSVLRKRNIPTLDIHLARTPKAACAITEEIDFPLIIRIPGKKTGMIAKTRNEAKSIIDALGSLKQQILIEQPVKDVVSVYVAGRDVLASIKKKTNEVDVIFEKGHYKSHKIDVETKHLAFETAHAIGAEIVRIDISQNGGPKVVNIDLNPDLVLPSKITGIDMPKNIINYIYDNYRRYKEKPLLIKFFEDAKSVVKEVFKEKHML
ncbi:MAG: hypothetical protein J7K72_04820 [Candidatus Aenigmarchaeota archaeon]|nr:hypothetical protein [Candidatus Aenigmarchaeota archaeon]